MAAAVVVHKLVEDVHIEAVAVVAAVVETEQDSLFVVDDSVVVAIVLEVVVEYPFEVVVVVADDALFVVEVVDNYVDVGLHQEEVVEEVSSLDLAASLHN